MDINYGLVALNIFFTWFFGLTPPVMIRFVFIARPLSRIAAVGICTVLFFISVIVAVAIGARSINALYLVALVSYFILTRPESSRKMDDLEPPLLKTKTLEASGGKARLVIDGFETHAGAVRLSSHSHDSHTASLESGPRKNKTVDSVGRVAGIRQSLEKLSALERNLIIIGVVFLLIVAFYYVASPYQNCIKNRDAPVSDSRRDWCMRNTSW